MAGTEARKTGYTGIEIHGHSVRVDFMRWSMTTSCRVPGTPSGPQRLLHAREGLWPLDRFRVP